MRSRFLQEHRDERGFVLLLFGISILVMCLLVGFAVDLGAWYLRAAKLQRATDGAALSGASVLPDQAAAINAANAAYTHNGFTNGGSITITNTIDEAGYFVSTIRDSNVSTFFTHVVFPNVQVSRSSKAIRTSASASLGSPFNVLGTGDLDMGPKMPKQNFWLAINGYCSPKEDGDYFQARYDGNKTGFTTALDANNNYIAPNGETNCPGGVPNPDYNGLGYSYFVDVPKPPTAGGSVDIKIYDPAGHLDPSWWTPPPDAQLALPKDLAYAYIDMAYDVFQLSSDPSDVTGTEVLDHPYMVSPYDSRTPQHQWWTLTTLPYSKIKDGGRFRIQIYAAKPEENPEHRRGVDSFSVGAFPTWEPAMQACDSRTDANCPVVYARDAISVYNNLTTATSGGQVDFYFAKIDPVFVGQTFDMMLWDPGEGVQKIELLGPDGTPLNFNWSAIPGGPGFSGTGNFVKTDDLIAQPGKSLSNPYKFNDRLLTLEVTLPSTYPGMVAAANSDYLRLRYTVGSAPADRTTWGIALAGGTSGIPHLVKTGP